VHLLRKQRGLRSGAAPTIGRGVPHPARSQGNKLAAVGAPAPPLLPSTGRRRGRSRPASAAQVRGRFQGRSRAGPARAPAAQHVQEAGQVQAGQGGQQPRERVRHRGRRLAHGRRARRRGRGRRPGRRAAGRPVSPAGARARHRRAPSKPACVCCSAGALSAPRLPAATLHLRRVPAGAACSCRAQLQHPHSLPCSRPPGRLWHAATLRALATTKQLRVARSNAAGRGRALRHLVTAAAGAAVARGARRGLSSAPAAPAAVRPSYAASTLPARRPGLAGREAVTRWPAHKAPLARWLLTGHPADAFVRLKQSAHRQPKQACAWPNPWATRRAPEHAA